MRLHGLVAALLALNLGCLNKEFAADNGKRKDAIAAPASPSPAPSIEAQGPIDGSGKVGEGGNGDSAATGTGGASDQPGFSEGGNGEKIVQLACNEPASRRSLTLRGKADLTVKVRGDFCASATGKLTVMLVIDYSGSMRTSDPTTSGSCGRYQAVKAILGKIQSDMRSGDVVTVGFVSFGSAARLQTQAPVAIDAFDKLVEANSFCGFLSASEGNTNYKAAFDETRSFLSNVNGGSKVMYFISDGMPTLGGGGPNNTGNADENGVDSAAGTTAHNELRAAIPGLTSNFIFLDKDPASAAQGRNYLLALSGSPDRVKVATDANQLADKIVELAFPIPVLVESQSRAEITSEGVPARTIGMSRFSRDPTRDNIYSFETLDFSLNSKPGVAVNNQVRIIGSDAAGINYDSLVNIIFTATP